MNTNLDIKYEVVGTLIKTYKMSDAPRGSIFLYHRIERNGFVLLDLPTYQPLKPNERTVYFFQIPKSFQQ